jgi:hypothetical protein
VATEIQQFQVTVPAGTAKASPVALPLTMPSRIVDQIDITTPPGARGEVGWALGGSGSAVLPVTPGAFMVTDGETVHWTVEEQMDNGAWQLIAYNTGQFNHSLYVAFHVRIPNDPRADGASAPRPGFTPIPNGALGD